MTTRSSVEKFSRLVSREEIRRNEYNLNIPRYVDSSEKAESWDIYASMFGGIPDSELEELHRYWDAFPDLRDALFASDNGAYCRLNVPDLVSAVRYHPSVTDFFSRYEGTFRDFPDFLRRELLDGMQTLNTAQEEATLSDAIFSRLEGIPLVDRYGAYQLLDEVWSKIAVDLEIIQTEGFAAAKQVDPNMVSKKKDGQDQEVQDGWTGHVLPFDLVQKALLPEALSALTALETRLSEISGEYDALLEELSEEDKELDFVGDSKDAFVAAEVKKAIKAKEVEPQTLAVLKKVDALINEEKTLRKQLKTDSAALHLKTKETIETLSDASALELLAQKWITPLVDSLRSLPDTILADFTGKLDAICKKYETTFAQVEEEIADTERELTALLDGLTGSEFDMQGLAEFRKLLGGE